MGIYFIHNVAQLPPLPNLKLFPLLMKQFPPVRSHPRPWDSPICVLALDGSIQDTAYNGIIYGISLETGSHSVVNPGLEFIIQPNLPTDLQ